jgi:hypothetical protein
LWEDVIPAWCETLTGRKTFESFCFELIPKGSRMLDLGYLPDHIITPEGYLEDIGLSPANGDELFPLFADRVKRASIAGFGLITMHGGL